MDWLIELLKVIISSGVVLVGYILVDRREKSKQLDGFKNEVMDTLKEHREEYLKGINEVKDSITDLTAKTQQTQAILELKIDALEKKQDKHNSIIERTYALERDVAVLKTEIKNENS